MGWQRLSQLLDGIGELILPNSCLVCNQPETGGTPLSFGFCDVCRKAITEDPHEVCPRCAATVGPFTDMTQGCGQCRNRSFGFEAAIRIGPYDGLLRTAVLRLKSLPGEILAERLGMLFAQVRRDDLARHAPDLVVPIPLHWRRRIARGYNQAEAIAAEVARSLGVPCQPGWLRRIQPTPQQVQPSASAREANVRGAFRAGRNARFQGRTVLIIDDVMTTGSTLGEASRVVRQAGAARVIAAVLARA
jgi:ComF family protein